MGRWWQKRIQFGLELAEPLSLLPDLFLELLKGVAQRGCFGHGRLSPLEQGIVRNAHDDTSQP
ncbi:hypothetical protein [Microvirga yunnanensis]|uniref:hypothetical protein n=1 Tax=Microvirga yunnanensis TaxID=2953740 RepID=UPI0021C9191E|nr:hypothetical protein [Microvirga sp. HBU65207]